ncbi:MAG: YggT family protein [Holosporaceae bacterium]|jgi:uncharacterized protein YggT (Ycf19 family)|nr:YggT family protein [Holosporaceae bacterium]
MDIILVPTLMLIKAVVGFSIVIIVTDVIVSVMVSANILNVNSHFIQSIVGALTTVSDFLLNPVRKRMPPNMGTAVDFSPVVFILLASFMEWMIDRILLRFGVIV